MINGITMDDVHTLQKRMLLGGNELGINMSFASRFVFLDPVSLSLYVDESSKRLPTGPDLW